MLRHQLSSHVPEDAPDQLRACVHDLRNLFAVVASARSLLERPIEAQRKRLVLDALARVALEGKIVTDALLSGDGDGACGANAAAEVQSLAGIIASLERPGFGVDLSVDEGPSWILMAPSEFRAVVLELVTNAAAAGASRIRIRAARRGCRYWLAVGDNGCGFAPSHRSNAAKRPAGLHGTGMRRVASAVEAARGNVRIRSKRGAGSVVAMILPIMGIVSPAVPEPVAVRRLVAAN